MTTHMLGKPSALPFAFAPTGFTRMMNHEGERAVVRVAARRDIPYALSTMGTTSIEDVAAAAPDARKWFQLYVWKDRAAAEDLMNRAKAAGFEALILTVDVPVAGARLRDARNGFSIPPALTAKTVLDAATHPAWWMNLLTTPPLTFASLTESGGTVAELIDALFDPSMTIADLEWMRVLLGRPAHHQGHSDGRRRAAGRRRRRGRRRVVQSRRPAARQGPGAAAPDPRCSRCRRRSHRGVGRHGHHGRRRHRGGDCPWRPTPPSSAVHICTA